MKEMGVLGTPIFGGFIRTPEKSGRLVGPERYKTFSEIVTNTSIVAAGVRYFLDIISRPAWTCEVAEGGGGQEAADFVQDVLDDMETPWNRTIKRSGTYRFHGFSIQEWTAKKRDDGKIGFYDVEVRPQWTIWRWEVDEQGTILGMWQRDPLTGRQLGLPRGKVLYLVDDTLTDSPEGLGLFRHLVEANDRLNEYLKQESYGFMRDLRGIPIGRAPVDELAKAVKDGLITATARDDMLRQIAEFAKLEVKDKNTALMLSSQPYISQTDTGNMITTTPKWGIELLAGAAPGLADVGKAIDRIIQEMARVLGTEHMLLGSDSAGSFALSKEKATALYLLANSVLRDIRLQVQHDIIRPLWNLNGFPDETMPQLKTEDVSPKDVEQVARVMRDMATAGSVIPPDDEVQNWVRDLLGAPQLDLKKMMEQAQQQQDLQFGLTPEQQAAEAKAQAATAQDKQDAKDAKAAVAKQLYKNGGKASHETANYREGTENKKCAKCWMFDPPNACESVASPIRPEGVCDFYEHTKPAELTKGESYFLRGSDGRVFELEPL